MRFTLDTLRLENTQGFIVIEGVNGAGKSTVINAIQNHLLESGHAVVKTHEPGDTPLGKELRTLLLNSPHIPRNSTAELLLFGADRSEHVDAVILPALKQGKMVVCDRYLYSTIAFQGYGRGLDLGLIEEVNCLAVRGTYPDLVILLDLDAAEGLKRTSARVPSAETADTFEREKLDFHNRIREGFLDVAKNCLEPFIVIDASQPVEEVIALALTAVSKVTSALAGSRKSAGEKR